MTSAVQFWINLVALLLSPVVAVAVTLWYQSRKEKRQEKLRLFLTLMAYRKRMISPVATDALNTIVVVFADTPKVVSLWNDYFDAIQSQVTPQQITHAGHVHLRLLSEMASSLGYKEIDQVSFDRYYLPQGQIDKANMEDRTQREFLRVLENSAAIQTASKPGAGLQQPPPVSQTNSIAPP